jgi:hypothetical protein
MNTGDKIIDITNFQKNTTKEFQLIMSAILAYAETNLFAKSSERWSLKGILNNDYSSILCFLVDLALLFNCQFTIPPNVAIAITNTQVVNGSSISKTIKVQVTGDVIQQSKSIYQSIDGIFLLTRITKRIITRASQ